ncbi:MAG: RNA polymerase sigma-70 factor [Candidatus Pseudobacter hemicellulosilyticus]|uniref:RNA polymerase sigma-70 factor n=1 Tax=Candidatus Pseudobacter hemicellulosilyticus TaxID=3121375 RepID=A0AAJ5WL80_9BACT|nr:MAG: RNA polymerase sigma-70 factor [Pseudobacter sp.]
MHQNEHIYEEAKLIALLNDGSEYAFQLIYDRYRNRIYRLAVKYLSSPLLAQEIVQDVFLKLWFERANIRTGRPIESWLVTVAKNMIINQLKKLARDWKAAGALKGINTITENPIFDGLKEKEYQALLNKAIDGLSDMQKAVYRLAREEQLSYLRIAEQLNISPLTVKTHMSRALDHIKSFFAERGILFLAAFLFS